MNSLSYVYINTGLLHPVEKSILEYIKNNSLNMDRFVHLLHAQDAKCGLLEYLNVLSNALAILLVSDQNQKKDLARAFSFLMYFYQWEEIQLCSSMHYLIHVLLNKNKNPIIPKQLLRGATPLHWNDHLHSMNLPFINHHAMIGVIWILIGHLDKNKAFIIAAQRLAQWHMNTLDQDFFPFAGLFSREKDYSLQKLLCSNYIFFHTLGQILSENQWKDIAQKQLTYLNKFKTTLSLPILPFAISYWLEKQNYKSTLSPKTFALEKLIYDPSTSLIGYRTKKYGIVCTLNGSNTGMGCIHVNNIRIVNFGPQMPPLSNSSSFGFEKSCIDAKKEPANISFDSTQETFTLKNTVKLISNKSIFHRNVFSGTWMDVNINFSPFHLKVTTQFLGTSSDTPITFVFYVQATTCTLHSGYKLKSLDQYQSYVQNVYLQDNNNQICITAEGSFEQMRIIPLSEDNSYWNANFLIAYYLESLPSNYSWDILQTNEAI